MSKTPENRYFTKSLSVTQRGSEAQSVLIELSPAPIYGGPEGMYRVRVSRKWLKLPDKKKLFFSIKDVLDGPVAEALGVVREMPQTLSNIPVDLPYNTRVSVFCGKKNGLPVYCQGWTVMEPIQGNDGLFYVAVSYKGKREFLTFDKVKLPTRNEIHRLDNHHRLKDSVTEAP